MLPAFDAGLRDVNVGRLEDARAAFERAAREGDPRGWFALGQLASEGRGEPENPAKAAALYQRAAEGGCAPAAHGLAALYAIGRGVARNPASAIAWYRRAAELGDADGAFKVGLMLARGEVGPPTPSDFVEAERIWRELAGQGHLAATLWLGHLYSYLLPEGSPVTASRFYLDVLERPDADPEARAEATRFVEELASLLVVSAFSGDPDAAFSLGRWHVLRREHARALPYLEQAATKAHAGAQRALADAYADERSLALYESAANGGDALAAIRLGVRFAIGNDVPKDPERAVSYLRQAAETGDVDGMALLGEELERAGRWAEARPWHVRAAERKHPRAMMAAANSYRDERAGPRDLVQAVRWYWSLLEIGNGDGIHEAHLLEAEMTDAELREAARLCAQPSLAEASIEVRNGRAR